MNKSFKDFLTEDLDGDIPVFAIYTLDIVDMLNAKLTYINMEREDDDKEPLPKYTKTDITPEIKEKVAKAFEEAIRDAIYERGGISYKNIVAPSEVWDTIEDIVEAKSKSE